VAQCYSGPPGLGVGGVRELYGLVAMTIHDLPLDLVHVKVCVQWVGTGNQQCQGEWGLAYVFLFVYKLGGTYTKGCVGTQAGKACARP